MGSEGFLLSLEKIHSMREIGGNLCFFCSIIAGVLDRYRKKTYNKIVRFRTICESEDTAMNPEFWNSLFFLKKLYDESLAPVCTKLGITRREMDVLLFLANNPSLDTASDMVEKRRLAKSHISSSIKSLEAAGMLTRVYHDGNKKTAHLKLLPLSDEIVEAGKRAQKNYFCAIFTGLSDADIVQMEKGLLKMAENAREAIRGGTEEKC